MSIDVAKGILLVSAGVFVALPGCAGAPPPPTGPKADPAPPPKAAATVPATKETLETGSPCLKGESLCDGGECVLSIKNGCDQALSCDATMTTTCKSGAEMIEAARRKRVTFAAGTDGEIRLVGDCASGQILRTAVKSVLCK